MNRLPLALKSSSRSSQVISGSAARLSNVARSSRSSARASRTTPLTSSDTEQSASAGLQALCGLMEKCGRPGSMRETVEAVVAGAMPGHIDLIRMHEMKLESSRDWRGKNSGKQ